MQLLYKLFNPTTELVIPIELLNKEAKVYRETHPVILEAKIGECSI